ncbi:hypothetical protein HY386_01565 [Candidatus Daviesbacteria bacterium]|nr:hypothetical protein [Candidatus Daviesbacteria bacterium]
MAKKIVTNLRIDEIDWLQVKTTAAELGMSANEYINYLIRDLSTKLELTFPEKVPTLKLSEISKKVKPKPMGELSEIDKIIYEE